jgi:hypothetical protein
MTAAIIVAAVITAAGALGAAWLQHWLSHRQSSAKGPLSFTAAQRAILGRATELHLELAGPVVAAPDSPFGTEAFVGLQPDQKSALYCHASGPRRGEVARVNGGIGWFYLDRFGASKSPLGLPISDEYDIEGGRRSDFEGGRIEWNRRHDSLRVISKDGSSLREWQF